MLFDLFLAKRRSSLGGFILASAMEDLDVDALIAGGYLVLQEGTTTAYQIVDPSRGKILVDGEMRDFNTLAVQYSPEFLALQMAAQYKSLGAEVVEISPGRIRIFHPQVESIIDHTQANNLVRSLSATASYQDAGPGMRDVHISCNGFPL